MAFIYFIGFLIVLNQFKPLLGKRGLQPVALFLQQVPRPYSLFQFWSSDTAFTLFGWLGLLLSLLALTGISEAHGLFLSMATWFSLWLIYLSYVNVGQIFYAFGWETMLLETGFLAIFLGPADLEPPVIVIWLLRWVLFRVMLGAGLIKLRGDSCWRDFKALFYHYETQPLPGPLSWYFHRFPPFVHKATVLFTHFVELVVPFGLFWPQILRQWSGLVTALFQVMLIFSGNLSWLNYITLVLCIPCFDNSWLSFLPITLPSSVTPLSWPHWTVLVLLALGIAYLSIRPLRNLFSRLQIMNTSYDPFHLVNTYGAFGSVTKVRHEIIFEGTDEPVITPATKWQTYEFRGKPGDVRKRPPQVAPYQFKLDWQIWFAAMVPYQYNPWTLSLVAKLLEGDKPVLSLFAHNPFPKAPPQFVRAQLYEYHFASPESKKQGIWWERRYVGEYLPACHANKS